MALEFFTGFDLYGDFNGMAQEWDRVYSATFAAGRFGGQAANGYDLWKFLPGGALATRTIGFAFQFPVAPNYALPMCWLYDNAGSASQLEINYNYATHQLTVTRNGTLVGTCSGTYLPGYWYYLEIQATISATAGAVKVNVYPGGGAGGSVFAATGLNTQTSANAAFDTLILGSAGFGGNAFNGFPILFDDLYVTNPSGTANAGFLGECRILSLLPTGDSAVNHAFTPSTGAAHFACVSQTDPTTDAPSVSATAVGAIDTYTFPAPALSGAIMGVKASVCARKSDTGVRTLASQMRDNAGGAHTGAAQALYSNYKFLGTNWDLNPATGAPWLAADLTGAEFGMQITG